jgi:hypothetical protein
MLGLMSHGIAREWTSGSVEVMKSEEKRGRKGRAAA